MSKLDGNSGTHVDGCADGEGQSMSFQIQNLRTRQPPDCAG